MSGLQFHETRMGRTFFERDFPELVRQLQRMNELMKQFADRLPPQPEVDGDESEDDR